MRVALIENGTSEPFKLLEILKEHEVSVITLEDSLKALDHDFDLIILSGSSRFPIAYNLDILAPEIRLVRESSVPLLGICFGCELIAVAFGGTLRDLGEKQKGISTITVTDSKELFCGIETFEVYEGHRWAIDQLPETFKTLALSSFGPEIVKHRTRPIYGFQFHPEKMLRETDGDELFGWFLAQVASMLPRN